MNKPRIICVDDEAIILQSLKQELKSDPFFQDYAIEVADSGPRALQLIEELLQEDIEIPIIISDQRMPSMKGDAFLVAAHNIVPDAYKILLTGYSDLEAVVHLVNHDILYRYIAMPWDRNDLSLTLRTACKAWNQKRLIAAQQNKIENLTMAMVTTLESANFFFDEETGNHIRRISRISAFIAEKAGCDEEFVKNIRMYAPLHDIGKVGVGKEILLKPASLTPEEFEQIKTHVVIGHQIINSEAIDSIAKNIVLYHHEKWAGSGYVNALQGKDIPLEARIVSIADVFDALVNKRVYKPAFSLEKALEIIESERGKSFDPHLVETFLHAVAQLDDPLSYFEEDH